MMLLCNFGFESLPLILHFKELQKLKSAVKRPAIKDVGLQFNFLIPMSGV